MTNSPERWTVNSRCINCMASRSLAPHLFAERDGKSIFDRQPNGKEELEAAWRAVQVCPVGAVEPPTGLQNPGPLFPHDLGQGIHRLGHNTRKSYGAHSYFVRASGGNVMVDGPRWARDLVQWIEDCGGLDHILLTHKDDVGDTDRYAEHFGAEVWIHEADAESAPFATTIIGEGMTDGPLPEFAIVPLPGHTRGSVGYLFEGETLFTGDTLSWDERDQALRGYQQFCWFDWDMQIESIGALRGLGFSRILAGHGGSVSLSPAEIDAKIAELVAREEA